jgi:hypothetical protein
MNDKNGKIMFTAFPANAKISAAKVIKITDTNVHYINTVGQTVIAPIKSDVLSFWETFEKAYVYLLRFYILERAREIELAAEAWNDNNFKKRFNHLRAVENAQKNIIAVEPHTEEEVLKEAGLL